MKDYSQKRVKGKIRYRSPSPFIFRATRRVILRKAQANHRRDRR